MSTGSTDARPPVTIQFVGVFDTIKVIDDDAVDLSFNRSIRHLRQALALHEDRIAFTPEVLCPTELYGTALNDHGRSMVQAWFVGKHEDIGGTAINCGLALYPYQWMLLEARQCGLGVDIPAQDCAEHKLLCSVMPKASTGSPWQEDEGLRSFAQANGIVVRMSDLRPIHEGPREAENSYAIRLASPKLGSIRLRRSRTPFTVTGHLQGYCDWAAQGTTIHPSVYLLFDEYTSISLETKELSLQQYIEDWRSRMLSTEDVPNMNVGFWLDRDIDDPSEPGAIRVLVCGNTGIYHYRSVMLKVDLLITHRSGEIHIDQQDFRS